MKAILALLLVLISMERFAMGDEAPWAPDFLIIGAQKAGTSALYKYINQHPKVKNVPNEIHFFDMAFSKGTTWYRRKFYEGLSLILSLEIKARIICFIPKFLNVFILYIPI